ncbi:MAG: hypothetical protein HZB79_02190 [Deltaproteobacteria bacterium]|nr:hypothetical protein [Deltaproteobacteria bacterium]
MNNKIKNQNGIELKPSSPLTLILSPKGRGRGEGGFALVVTLLLMVSISLIGLLALMNASTETLIARNEKEQKIAFQLAEAGLNETYARLHVTGGNYIGEPSGTTTRTGDAVVGSGIAAGSSSTSGGLNTASASTGQYSVVITYLAENSTDAFCNGGTWDVPTDTVYTVDTAAQCTGATAVLFGHDFGFPYNMSPRPPLTGRNPVYKITSTGTYGNTNVSLYSYIPSIGLNIDPEAAVYSTGGLDVNGNDTITGGAKYCTTYDASGTNTISPAATPITSNCLVMDTFIGYSKSELWSMADVKVVGDGGAGLKTTVTDPANADKIIFVDNDAAAGPSSNTTASNANINTNQSGSGILIVTGDLAVGGGFTWTGLIYVFGTLTTSGNVTVTGAVVAGGTEVTLNGTVTVTYDQDVLNNLGKKNSTSSLIRWSRQ